MVVHLFEYGTFSYKLKGFKREVSTVVLDGRADDDDNDVVVCHVLKTR